MERRYDNLQYTGGIDNTECNSESTSFVALGTSSNNAISMLSFLGFSNNNFNVIGSKNAQSNNNQTIDQQTSQVHIQCDGSFCRNVGGARAEVGSSQDRGGIFFFGDNNKNLISNINVDSNNNNGIGQQVTLLNNQCTDSGCENLGGTGTAIGTGDHGGVFSLGNNNSNIDDNKNLQSNNFNKVTQTISKNNQFCSLSGCENTGSSLVDLGISRIGGTFSIGEGNTNYNINRNQESNNNSIVSYSGAQDNTNCSNSGCANNGFSSITVGSIGSFSEFIGNSGNRNVNIHNASNQNSNNNNDINQQISQENLQCTISTLCFNSQRSFANIGSSNIQVINNFGDNNNNSVTDVNIDSNNDNTLGQNILQENKLCTNGSQCANSVDFVANIGTSSNGNIDNFGTNNTISQNFVNVNSNNENKVTQHADQLNTACDNTSCGNTVVASVEIGSSDTGDVSSGEVNATSSQSMTSVDTNNNNIVSQQVDQNNLCRTSLECSNTGNLTAGIDGENSKEIDQTLIQDNLCVGGSACSNDGKIVQISGSNTQSNICTNGALCTNAGTDNQNTCTNGAVCTNTGTNTKLISTGDACTETTDNSKTICRHGRIITRPLT